MTEEEYDRLASIGEMAQREHDAKSKIDIFSDDSEMSEEKLQKRRKQADKEMEMFDKISDKIEGSGVIDVLDKSVNVAYNLGQCIKCFLIGLPTLFLFIATLIGAIGNSDFNTGNITGLILFGCLGIPFTVGSVYYFVLVLKALFSGKDEE